MEEDKKSNSKKIKNSENAQNIKQDEKRIDDSEDTKKEVVKKIEKESKISNSDDNTNTKQKNSNNNDKKSDSSNNKKEKIEEKQNIMNQNSREQENNEKNKESNEINSNLQDNNEEEEEEEEEQDETNNNDDEINEEEEEEEAQEDQNEEEEEEEEEAAEEEEEEEEEEVVEDKRKPKPVKKYEKSDRSDTLDEEEETTDSKSDDDFNFDTEKLVISKILAHKTDEDNKKKFLVKFANRSYRKCKWMTGEELKSLKSAVYNFYIKKHKEASTPEPYFDPNYTIPEKILTTNKRGDETYYLIKWKDLDYNDCTWEESSEIDREFPEAIEQYNKTHRIPSFDQLFIPPRPSPQSFRPITHHPSSKSGYQIRQYQLSGLNFLVNSWYNKRNAILADEMGLGKTAQAIMFLDYLDKQQAVHGPFLIVAPLSTIPHWKREIAEWSSLAQITYCGDLTYRRFTRNYEMFYPKTNIPMFQVLLTTYEYIIRAEKLFNQINWRAIIIDEAQRMKNHQSKLFNTLKSYNSDFKLLLTGTPLQNNIDELWSLLNFLDPNAFDNLHKFQENFSDFNEVEHVLELQLILKPMMLRRLKSDVEKSIAPLEEIIIECPMTPYQKAYYKSIYDKNLEYLNRGAHKGNASSLNNIAMELRKVCNHPFLINGAEDQIIIEKKESMNLKENDEPPANFELDLLVRTAGKMILLDKLLYKLKQDGHRVLIFSQMTKMLDIIQDYLDLREYKFCRIDGSVRSEVRQQSIDDFNKQGSDYFVFLLCTRSGGVGINLASADTVIIYDSDYNPQNDIQATSRCHRIGQKKEVKMYRFITSKSYERKMFDMASIKLGLDHAVLGGGKKDDLSKFDIEKLLRFGAYYAYEEEDDNKEAETFGEEDIDSVISRSTRIQHASVVGGEGSTFSKAHFEISENDADVDLTAPDFWQKYTPVVHEDEDFDCCSIAERYRKTKERLSLEDLNEKLNSPSSSSSTPSLSKLAEPKSPKSPKSKKEKDDNLWSLNKISKLMNAILRFGWGRWNKIIEASNLQLELRKVIAASHVILKWLIEASTEASPIMTSINQKCIENDKSDPEMIEMQNFFIVKNRKTLFQTITNGSNWKLGRLELLYFIDTLVKSSKNPPEDIPIPPVNSIKPTDWWTLDDDKLLIYNTWKYGFSNYNNEEFKFSQNIAENTKRLTNRLHTLMNNLKNTYATYKTKNKNSEDLTFSCEVLSQALNQMTSKDHKNVVDTLILVGEYPDIKKFKEIGKLQNKTDEKIQGYIQKVIDYCKALKSNEPVDSIDIIEPISIPKQTRLLNRINFFNEIRNNKIELTNENDKKLIDYLCDNGFLNIQSELEWVKEKYDLNDLSEYNLIKLTHRIRRKKKSPKSGTPVIRTRTSRSTRSSGLANLNPDYKVYIDAPYLTKKEDGSYKFPIQITQKIKLISIGEVVYDRPYYHTDKYIYPVGYTIEKEFYSIEDPNNQAVYRASILDGGEHPLFKVECLDKSKMVFEGNSPSKPWMEASLAIEASKKKFGLPTKDVVTISGPVAYGFPLPVVTCLIDRLPNARKCENHVFKKYVIRGEDEENDENEEEENKEENGDDNVNEEEEEMNEEFDYDENEEDEKDENKFNDDDDEENDDDESNNDDDDDDGYSEEESYDDRYDGDYQKIRIRMRRVRVSKKKKDYLPSLHLVFSHLDEFEDDLNQKNKDVNISFHSNQLVNLDPIDFNMNHNRKNENAEDQLKEAVINLAKKIDQ